MIKKYVVLLMLGMFILPISLSAQSLRQSGNKNGDVKVTTLRPAKKQTPRKGKQETKNPEQQPYRPVANSMATIGSEIKLDLQLPDVHFLKKANEKASQEAAAEETTEKITVWTCAFCGEPILHDHQKCSGKDNPFDRCTHTDLNWGTPLHKGEHREGREKSTYNVPFEPSQVEVARPVAPQPAASVSSKENK